jgi:hypothetical protein
MRQSPDGGESPQSASVCGDRAGRLDESAATVATLSFRFARHLRNTKSFIASGRHTTPISYVFLGAPPDTRRSVGQFGQRFLKPDSRVAGARLATVILDSRIGAIIYKLLFQLSDNSIDFRIALA